MGTEEADREGDKHFTTLLIIIIILIISRKMIYEIWLDEIIIYHYYLLTFLVTICYSFNMSKIYCPVCLMRGFEENCPAGKEKQHAKSKVHQACVIANNFEHKLNLQDSELDAKHEYDMKVQELTNNHQLELLEQRRKYEKMVAEKEALLRKYIDSVHTKKKKTLDNGVLKCISLAVEANINEPEEEAANSDDEWLGEERKKNAEGDLARQQKEKEEWEASSLAKRNHLQK